MFFATGPSKFIVESGVSDLSGGNFPAKTTDEMVRSLH